MGWFGKGTSGNGAAEGAPGDDRRIVGMEAEAGETPLQPIEPAPDPRASLAGLLARTPFMEPVDAPIPTEGAADTASVFSESVEIDGSIEGQGDVMLRGRVRGSVNISGTLIVGQGGVVQADVMAREVVNAGTVEGNITAAEKVRVQATGVVQGDIDAPSIIIDDGGGVEGFVQMKPPGGADEEDEVEPDRPSVPPAGRFRATSHEAPPRLAPPAPLVEPAAAPEPGQRPSGGDPFADFTAPASGESPAPGEPWTSPGSTTPA